MSEAQEVVLRPDAGPGTPRQAPHASQKILGEASPAPRPHSFCRPLRSGCGAGPPSHPLHPGQRGADGGSVNGKATELSPFSLGCRRIARPTPEDCGPLLRRYSPGSDALPSWYAVAACCPSRRGPEIDSPCLALPTVPSSGRCKSTLPQPERHGKKKMRRFCSEFILVVKRVRPQLLDAGPRRRLSILPYNPRLPARVGLTRSMPCR